MHGVYTIVMQGTRVAVNISCKQTKTGACTLHRYHTDPEFMTFCDKLNFTFLDTRECLYSIDPPQSTLYSPGYSCPKKHARKLSISKKCTCTAYIDWVLFLRVDMHEKFCYSQWGLPPP